MLTHVCALTIAALPLLLLGLYFMCSMMTRGTKHAMLQYADTRIAALPLLLLGLHYRLASYMCSMVTRLL